MTSVWSGLLTCFQYADRQKKGPEQQTLSNPKGGFDCRPNGLFIEKPLADLIEKPLADFTKKPLADFQWIVISPFCI